MTKLVANKKCPPVGALIAAKAVEGRINISLTWGDNTYYTLEGGSIGATTSVGVAR